jgi:hypothetical protein
VLAIRGKEAVPAFFKMVQVLVYLISFKVENTWFGTAEILYEASLKFKTKFSGVKEREVRMRGRACQPLFLQVGAFYRVSKYTTFKYWLILSNLTITLLLY